MTRIGIYSGADSHDDVDSFEVALDRWQQDVRRLAQSGDALRAAAQNHTHRAAGMPRAQSNGIVSAESAHIACQVAHEMCNSLVPVRLHLTVLKRRLEHDPGSLDALAKVETGVHWLESLAADLLNFTSERPVKLVHVELTKIVGDALLSLAPKFDAREVETVVDIPRGLSILADASMICRAVLNLAMNALDAMPHGGRLVVTACHGPDGIELEVADSGSGLNDEARKHAFEPCFTTKVGNTGLGLAIVHRIVERHGGSVVAANCPEGGAAFTLRFPRPALEAAA